MKIAITGASGFIGSELTGALSDYNDISIVGLTRGGQKEDSDRMSWFATDYSVESLTEGLKGIDVVVHLAAVRGTAGTLADYSVNEVITENLLRAAGECGVKRFVFASSIAVYSDTAAIPWTEEMRLTPKTLYGITKAACEHLCQYYSRQYGYDSVILRIAQVLGTGEKRRVMTNVFIELAKEGKQLKVMGKSAARRQYIYSRDLGEILARLATEDHGSVILNAGMDEACTNLEIASLVNEVYHNPQPVDYDDSKPETIEPSCMSTELIKSLLSCRFRGMKEALTDISMNY